MGSDQGSDGAGDGDGGESPPDVVYGDGGESPPDVVYGDGGESPPDVVYGDATGIPAVGDPAPAFEALLCDGETFRARCLSSVLGDRGCLLVFYAFTHSAVAENWWGRYDRRGWDDFPVGVVGVCRDGPYAQNAFLRSIDSPFRSFSDVTADAIEAWGLLADRAGMGGARTARRAVFLVDADRTVRGRWVMDDWISPIPADDVEAAVERF